MWGSVWIQECEVAAGGNQIFRLLIRTTEKEEDIAGVLRGGQELGRAPSVSALSLLSQGGRLTNWLRECPSEARHHDRPKVSREVAFDYM